MKIEQKFHLPGTLDKVSGLEKTEKGGVKISITGQKILEVMDKMMVDDETLTAAIKAGKDPMKDGSGKEKMNEMMFGSKTVEATVNGDLKPLFDYKAEVEKAKAAQKDMFKKLGVDPDAENAPRDSFKGRGGRGKL